MDNKLLTVQEVADLLRTTPNTIYRWLRAGKLPGIKIGKEWRIKSAVLEGRLSDTSTPSATNFWEKMNPNKDHIMVITDAETKVNDLEADFFKYGLSKGHRIFKGCWWQHPDEVRKELSSRDIDVETLEKQDRLVISDLGAAFSRTGIDGAIEAWREAADHSRQRGYSRMWGSGSPDMLSCGEDFSNLSNFESGLNKTLSKLPVVGICPYIFVPETKECFKKLIRLTKHHSGVLFYDDDSILLKNDSA